MRATVPCRRGRPRNETTRLIPHDCVVVYYLEKPEGSRVMRAFRRYLDAVQCLVEEMAPLVDYVPGEPITLGDLQVVETRAWAQGGPRFLLRLINLEERVPFPVNGKAVDGELVIALRNET